MDLQIQEETAWVQSQGAGGEIPIPMVPIPSLSAKDQPCQEADKDTLQKTQIFCFCCALNNH